MENTTRRLMRLRGVVVGSIVAAAMAASVQAKQYDDSVLGWNLSGLRAVSIHVAPQLEDAGAVLDAVSVRETIVATLRQAGIQLLADDEYPVLSVNLFAIPTAGGDVVLWAQGRLFEVVDPDMRPGKRGTANTWVGTRIGAIDRRRLTSTAEAWAKELASAFARRVEQDRQR